MDGPGTSITLSVFPGWRDGAAAILLLTRVESWKEDRVYGGVEGAYGDGGGEGRQFCPRRAMLGAIDHAISVVRQDRMAERVDNWTPTTPEVRVMTLEGGHAKTAPRQPPHPSRFHLRCLWRGTHKKEYVTSTDNSRLSLSVGTLPGNGDRRNGSFCFFSSSSSSSFHPPCTFSLSLLSPSYFRGGRTPSPRGLGDTPRFEPDLFMRSPVYGYRVKQCYVGVYFGASPPPPPG